MDVSIADGSQDALLVRVETDDGITGIGEVDSLPPVVKTIVDAPPSHAIASGLRHLLIGENPLEIDRLWKKLFRGSIYYGPRRRPSTPCPASTSPSGTSRAKRSAQPSPTPRAGRIARRSAPTPAP